jgi:secreted trypsin-like serine protease
MCTAYHEGEIDSCQGDSGEPLVWLADKWTVLVGVVSWGYGCAQKLRYGVYTRAMKYADWAGKIVAGDGR